MAKLILTDSHSHSDFSTDSSTPMETMVQQAIRLGLERYIITDHLDPDYPVPPGAEAVFLVERNAYQAEVLRLKAKYQNRIEILFGVEYGIQPQLGQIFYDWMEGLPLDFIIASTHVVNGVDPYLKVYFEGRSEPEAFDEYFHTFLPNIAAFGDFSVYGHLDYVVRYGPNRDRFYRPEDHLEVLDPAMRRLIELGKGIELNTSGWAKGLNMPHPHPVVLRRYRELGGEIVTVGSDAHSPDRIAYDFDRARDLLLDCGFKYYAYYKALEPVFLPL